MAAKKRSSKKGHGKKGHGKKAASKKGAKKALKPCQRRIKGGRVVLKKGYRYGANGACIKVKKK